jgi:hypothetical protein
MAAHGARDHRIKHTARLSEDAETRQTPGIQVLEPYQILFLKQRL